MAMKDIFGGIQAGGSFGGWQLLNQPINEVTKDITTAVEKAKEGYTGINFKPLWLVGAQVVNGMNYLFICEAEYVTQNPEKHIIGVIINTNGDKAKIVRVIGSDSNDVPTGVVALFNASKKVLNSANSKLLFYIGSQVVKGVNYYAIAEVTPLRSGNDPYPALVTINVIDGTPTVKIERIK